MNKNVITKFEPMSNGEVLNAVIEAMSKQKYKFGEEPIATNENFITILGEEFGEVCRAVNQKDYKQLQHEAIQCIAVIIAHLQCDLHYGSQK